MMPTNVPTQELLDSDWDFLLTGPMKGLTKEFLDWYGIKKHRDAFMIPVYRKQIMVDAILYRPGKTPKWQPLIKLEWRDPFNIDVLLENNDVVWITEGPKDALYAMFNGIPAISMISGAMSFQENWIRLFANVKLTLILLDNDLAGKEGAFRIKKFLPRSIILDFNKSPWDKMREDKADLADFFQAGYSTNQLTAWAESCLPNFLSKILRNK